MPFQTLSAEKYRTREKSILALRLRCQAGTIVLLLDPVNFFFRNNLGTLM